MKRFFNFLSIALVVMLFNSCGIRESVYHIPQTSIYVKLETPFNQPYGYIYINDRQAFEKGDGSACIQVHRSDVSMTSIIFKRNTDSIMYIRNASDNAKVIDSGIFLVSAVKLGDSIIYQPHPDIEFAFTMKPQYYCIYIDGFLNNADLVRVDSVGKETFIEIPKLE